MKFKPISADEKKLDESLVQIITKYNLTSLISAITMTNLSAERKKFYQALRKEEVYNPQFVYKSLPEHFDKEQILAELDEIKQEPQSSIGELLEKKRQELINIVHLFCAIGTDEFTKRSQKVFSHASDKLIKYAQSELDVKIFKMKAEPSKKNRPVGYFVTKCENFIEELNLGWKVCVKNKHDMLNRVKVKLQEKELWINEDKAPFTDVDIDKLLQHEVYVHIQRYENGSKSPLKILQYGTAGYIATEEGLAGFFELKHGGISPWFHKTKVLLVIAETKALESSFYDVFMHLQSLGVSKQKAFSLATRVKRGLIDTSLPGAFTKDHVYLEGEKLIEEYYFNGGEPESLLIGKFGLDDIELLFEKE